MSMAGIRLVHVPYKGGAPGVIGLMSGEVQVNFATITAALPHVKTGRLRPLAISTARRSGAAPGIPTVSESGLSGFEYASWIGLLAPAGTPRAIIGKLNAECVRAVQTPEIKDILAAEGSEPVGSTPEKFAVKAAGIKPQ